MSDWKVLWEFSYLGIILMCWGSESGSTDVSEVQASLPLPTYQIRHINFVSKIRCFAFENITNQWQEEPKIPHCGTWELRRIRLEKGHIHQVTQSQIGKQGADSPGVSELYLPTWHSQWSLEIMQINYDFLRGKERGTRLDPLILCHVGRDGSRDIMLASVSQPMSQPLPLGFLD